jgi:cell division protein FtsB
MKEIVNAALGVRSYEELDNYARAHKQMKKRIIELETKNKNLRKTNTELLSENKHLNYGLNEAVKDLLAARKERDTAISEKTKVLERAAKAEKERDELKQENNAYEYNAYD